ncbi:UNVERIFIED_CONTAM: hypothetical protein FKN15_001382 [Acipenser sinensis]
MNQTLSENTRDSWKQTACSRKSRDRNRERELDRATATSPAKKNCFFLFSLFGTAPY